MSGLERTTDALLERKAIQLSNHQRAQSRIDDTLLKIRTHTVSARAAASDITRLGEDMKLHAEDLSASDEAAAHLADRHTLQTATTNVETDKAVAFGRAFKDLADCNKGLVERIATAIETGKSMGELTAAHSSFLRQGWAMGQLVQAISLQQKVLRMSSGIAGHSIVASHDSNSHNNTATTTTHPLLQLDLGLQQSDAGAGSSIASSTAQWDGVLASIVGSTSDLAAQRTAALATQASLLATIDASRAALAEVQARKAAVLLESENLRAAIEEAKATLRVKQSARGLVEGPTRASLEDEASRIKSRMAAKEAVNASAQNALSDRCKVLEEVIVSVCDAKHEVAAAVEGLQKEQSALVKAVAENEAANEARRRSLCAKIATAHRLETLHFKAAQRVLALKRGAVTAQQATAALREQQEAMQRALAAKEDEAIRFEWAVAHQQQHKAAVAQLLQDEDLLRAKCEGAEWEASFACLEIMGTVSAAEVEARRLVVCTEEPAEWDALLSTITTAIADQKTRDEAAAVAAAAVAEEAAALALLQQQQQQREAAKKRPRDPAAPSALMTGHRAPMTLLNNAASVVDLPSSQQQQPYYSSSGLAVPSTPLRNTNRASAATPNAASSLLLSAGTPSKTMASAHALLANTSSLLLEAGKPIQPMMVGGGGAGGFIALGGGAKGGGGGLLLAATPRRQQQQQLGTVSSSQVVSRPVTAATPSGKLLPLPPGTTLPNGTVVGRATSAARAGSEESVISLFRSVSMPQQQQQALAAFNAHNNASSSVLTMANLGRNIQNNNPNLLGVMGPTHPTSSSLFLSSTANHNNTTKVPTSVANWNPIPPSPTPTDLGGIGPAGMNGTPTVVLNNGSKQQVGFAAHLNNNGGASVGTDESEDEISLSRLVQQQQAVPTVSAPTMGKRTTTVATPVAAPRGSGGTAGVAVTAGGQQGGGKGRVSPSPRKPAAKGRVSGGLTTGTVLGGVPVQALGGAPATPTKRTGPTAALLATGGAKRATNAAAAVVAVGATPTRAPFSNITNTAATTAKTGGGGSAQKALISAATPSKATPVRKTGGSGGIPRGATIVTPRGGGGKASDDDFTATFGL